ncbi:hypothetical protein FACS189444_4170 [Spirochaetia bacterium]|nr:hypothetical protein FACS189444_4170 [Spirochaetia bacterium]
MKQKVDFKKLLCGDYWNFSPEIDFEMINWFFKTGLQGQYETTPYKWHRAGINQLLWGYSMNNENNHYVPFPIGGAEEMSNFVRAIMVNAIVAPNSWDGNAAKIAEWREKNKISLDQYRMMTFPDPNTNDPRRLLWHIADFKGREIKKEFAHPGYKKRTVSRIIQVIFSTYGHGYFVKVEFSFWEFNYEPGWSMPIAEQGRGEYLGDFLLRAKQKLEEITVEIDDRALFQEKEHFIDFSERGCFNCVWTEDEEPGICGRMNLHKIKNPTIDRKGRCFCDSWRLKGFGNGTSND